MKGTMTRVMSYVLACATAFQMVACNNTNATDAGTESDDGYSVAQSSDRQAVVEDTEPLEIEEQVEVEEETYKSPFDKVEMWQITFTSVTTIYKPVSAQEAKRIEAAGDDDYWVDYDENQQQWYLHGHEDVDVGSVTVTDDKWVRKLNRLMQNPEYDDYSEDVTIRGKIAYAKWYDGNRGGGIADDFPTDVVDYLMSLRK